MFGLSGCLCYVLCGLRVYCVFIHASARSVQQSGQFSEVFVQSLTWGVAGNYGSGFGDSIWHPGLLPKHEAKSQLQKPRNPNLSIASEPSRRGRKPSLTSNPYKPQCPNPMPRAPKIGFKVQGVGQNPRLASCRPASSSAPCGPKRNAVEA